MGDIGDMTIHQRFDIVGSSLDSIQEALGINGDSTTPTAKSKKQGKGKKNHRFDRKLSDNVLITDLRAHVVKTEAHAVKMEIDNAELKARLEKMDVKATSLDSKVESLNSKVESLDKKMDQVTRLLVQLIKDKAHE